MEAFIKKHKTVLVKKQNALKKKFKLDCSTKYTIDKTSLLAFNAYEPLLFAKYQIIGTYNNKSCIWRWAWSNDNIPSTLSKLSKNSIRLADTFKNNKYSNSKVKGKLNAFNFMVAMSSYDPKIEGYVIYRKPYTTIDIYILVKNCKNKKPKKSKKSKIKSC
jgi:hypothetical protein